MFTPPTRSSEEALIVPVTSRRYAGKTLLMPISPLVFINSLDVTPSLIEKFPPVSDSSEYDRPEPPELFKYRRRSLFNAVKYCEPVLTRLGAICTNQLVPSLCNQYSEAKLHDIIWVLPPLPPMPLKVANEPFGNASVRRFDELLCSMHIVNAALGFNMGSGSVSVKPWTGTAT